MQVRRADDRRRDDEAARAAGEGAGADRRARTLGARQQDRDRDGCAAPAAGGRRRDDALRRREAPRRAVPRAARGAGHAAARRADEPSRRRERRVARAVSRRVSRAPSSRSRTIGISSTTSRTGFSSSIAAPEFRTRATTLVARAEAHAPRDGREEGVGAPAHAASASSSGCAWRRARGRRRTRRAFRSTRSWRRRHEGEKVMQNEIVIPPPPRLGNDVVIAKDLKKAFGDKLLFDDLTFSLPRGGIVGIIGPNGAGKTTLFRMIVGKEKPDGGSLEIGETVQLAYVDQRRALNDDEHGLQGSERRARHDQVGKSEINTRAYLSSFNFRGTDQQKKVGPLGRRAQSAASCEDADDRRQPAAARRADERSRRRHAARARRCADRLRGLRGGDLARSLVPRPHRDAHPRVRREFGDGVVRGELPRYIEDFKKRKGADADQPHRIAYKKLVRR